MRRSELIRLLRTIKGTVEEIYSGRLRITDKQHIVDQAELLSKKICKYREIEIHMENSAEWYIAFWAGLLAGCRVYVVDSDWMIPKEQLKFCSIKKLIQSERDLQELFYEDEKDIGDDKELTSEVVLFTTGTTGTNKGVVITVQQLMTNLKANISGSYISQQDNALVAIPLSHAMGIGFGENAFVHAKDIRLCKNIMEIISQIRNGKSNITAFPPSVLNVIIKNKSIVEKLRKWRFIMAGGADAGKAQMQEYYSLGLPVLNAYGMTECVSGIAITRPDCLRSDGGMEVYSVNEVKLSAENEILVKSPYMAECYLDGTKIKDPDGYFHSRDCGHMEGQFLYVDYRMDSVVVLANGYKLNTDQLEKRIKQIHGIEDCYIYEDEDGVRCDCILTDASLTKEQIKERLYYYEHMKICFVDSIRYNNRGKKCRERRR